MLGRACHGAQGQAPLPTHTHQLQQPQLCAGNGDGTGAMGQLHARAWLPKIKSQAPSPGPQPYSVVAWPHTQLLHCPKKQTYFPSCCSSFLARVTGQAHPHQQQTQALPKHGTAKGSTMSPWVTWHTHPVQHCASDWYLWDKLGNTEIRFATQMSLLPLHPKSLLPPAATRLLEENTHTQGRSMVGRSLSGP